MLSAPTLIAAAGIDLTAVTALVQSLATGLSTLVLPLGIVGIVLGVVMVLVGYNHGSNTIRTAAIAIVVGGMAKVIATALASTTGG